MKSLVEKIPSNRDELFAYPLDRSLVDEVLMSKRVRPWVNKKVIEYIGDGKFIHSFIRMNQCQSLIIIRVTLLIMISDLQRKLL